MSYALVTLVIIALISIAYVWYVTRGLNSIADDQPLSLDSDDDKLLIHWYKLYTKNSFDFNITDQQIAAKYLQRIHNIDINHNLIVAGNNLDAQYHKLTGNHLLSVYTDNSDCIFDIRSVIGKNGEIAIIHNDKIRDSLKMTNNLNLSDINDVIDSDIDTVARDFLQEILRGRWQQITDTNNSSILNSEGSYLYMTLPDDILSPDTVTLPGNIIAAITPIGARINLLCTHLEFESLISRLSQSMIMHDM